MAAWDTLKRRADFTRKVEEAIKDGTTAALVEEIAKERVALSAKLQAPVPKEEKEDIVGLQVLLRDQLDAARNLPGGWSEELKVYEEGGTYKASCSGIELPIGSVPPASFTRLVVTPLSRQARKAYFQAASSGKVFLARGPPGTGKTETFKDISNDLGAPAEVFSVSEAMTIAEIKTALDESQGRPVVFDEFTRISPELMEEFKQVLKESKVLVGATCDPDAAAGKNHTVSLDDISVAIDLTVPDHTCIMDCMFCGEGFTEAETVAEKFMLFWRELQSKLGPLPQLDFGMRTLKAVASKAGALGRSARFSDQLTLAVAAACWTVYPRIAAGQKEEVLALAKAHAGTALELPAGWPNCLTMLRDTMGMRHGVAVLGVDQDADACIAALAELAKKEGCEVARVPGTFDGGSPEKVSTAFGPVLESAVEAGKKVWIVVVQGQSDKSAAIYLENFNTVLDDNKVLCYGGGKRVGLNPDTRVVFLVKDFASWTPASISRVGIVLADGDKGW